MFLSKPQEGQCQTNRHDSRLQIVPVRRSEHMLFNLYSYNFFRRSERGKAMLFFGRSKFLSILISVPYILGCELAFFRAARFFLKLGKSTVAFFVLRGEPDSLFIGSLGVAPDYRRQGYAQQIIQYSSTISARLGKRWLSSLC